MRKQTAKIILIIVIISEIILLNIPPAFAISVSSIAEDLEERYHLNLESIQNQGETFNVASNKETPPQAMLFFSPSDPRVGEKLTAEALPMYFSNPKEDLYYTWYLEHDGCDLDDNPSDEEIELCDKDDDDEITVNDWKIEAMRIITRDDFDISKADYGSDDDGDGYDANWGGDDREDMPNYCYVHDFESGANYELNDTSSATFNCSAGETAVCVANSSLFCSTATSYTEYNVCQEIEETPRCNSSGLAACPNGTAVCTSGLTNYSCDSPPASENAASCSNVFAGVSTPTCDTSSAATSGANLCRHLFPEYNEYDKCVDLTPNDDSDTCVNINLDGKEVADGSFGRDEEAFWRTSPQDPDTANRGNMDEAAAAGLGANTFTWNYQSGDKVGVVIEGTSMIPTKHDDSSMMIMWALPKNDCPVTDTGEYTKNIKGYNVTIPSTSMDLDDCLERNLVDPREGVHPSNLDASLSYSPENPVNDPTGDEMGDVIFAEAAVSNASREGSQILYKWDVEMSTSPSDELSWENVTADLLENGLIPGPVEGIGLSSFEVNLNLNESNFSDYETYFSEGTGYIKIKVSASENFDEDVVREGKTDAIVKVISTEEKIDAYTAGIGGSGKLTIGEDDIPICQNPDTGERTPLCFVLKNEIVGVQIDNTDSEMENFSWTLNGNSLNCNSAISDLCSDEKQTSYNFFPITGNAGDTYAIGLTANDVESGKTINLSRTFRIIRPFLRIVSSDTSIAWPRYLGDYIDLNGNRFADNSETVFETYAGNSPRFRAEFHPAWLADHLATGLLQLEWTVDGVKQTGVQNTREISLSPADKEPGSVYNISLNSVYRPSSETRLALKNIWDISQFDATEKYMSHSIQMKVFAPEPSGTLSLKNSGKFLANLLSYLPGQITFLLRIILTIFTILLTTAIVFAFIPEPAYPPSPRLRQGE